MTGFGQEETAGNGILKEILEVVWAPITLGPALSPALQQFSVQIFRSGPGREAMLQYQGPCLREAQKTRELSPELYILSLLWPSPHSSKEDTRTIKPMRKNLSEWTPLE
ncbi:hypothetical protein Y1Q_0000659 [Alligator mississippiensis]|uniref:Uncharacterized protein n=1 Tax=Alligator mississippiensis TaxID=8496 RepID=A0A151MBZ9_ALLMI|nr:hypothetical protein Y1Q_0000659 [Alligator mississippiensis]